MKKLHVRAILVWMTFFNPGYFANAQDNFLSENTSPKIEFEKQEHDYGKIIVGDNGDIQFSFKNTGKEPLVLSRVHGCCGVSVLDWSKEPVLPDATGFIKLRYHTSRIGTINKVVTVNTNDPDNQTVHLRLRGEVLTKPAE